MLPRFLKGLNDGGSKPAEEGGWSLSAEGSKGGAIMKRSWDEDQSLRLWRHRGGNSGVRRTEASSLGEWREMARLTTGVQWSPDPLETKH